MHYLRGADQYLRGLKAPRRLICLSIRWANARGHGTVGSIRLIWPMAGVLITGIGDWEMHRRTHWNVTGKFAGLPGDGVEAVYRSQTASQAHESLCQLYPLASML